MDVELAQKYVSSGIEVTKLKIVRNIEDFRNDDLCFTPDMCHQVFGENETIFGYTNLRVNIYFDAATFKCFVNYTFDEKMVDDLKLNLSPENIIDKLDPWLPSNYFTNKNEFLECVSDKNKPRPFGSLLHSFTVDHESKKNSVFEIYTCKSKEPDYPDFHQRMETLIVWFIDAANFIDIDDPKWQFFVLYEKITEDGITKHFPMGYSTVYEYYAYPDKRRYRISQFIVFPPYQNVGLGTEMLTAILQHLSNLDNIFDITVEDPSEKFQSLRDYLDAKHCLTLPVFNIPNIKGDFSAEMISEARNKFKINEKQSRRIYEILRLYHTNVEDAKDFKAYKIMVKNRLNAPFKRQQQNNKKCRKYFKDVPQLQADHNIKIIEKEFQLLLQHYRYIIYRLQKQQ